jgi:ankyrin repeat protein
MQSALNNPISARLPSGRATLVKGDTMLRFLLLAMTVIGGFAHAQTAPSASDIASYSGLHLAAHEGDVDEINRLLAAGADVDIHDRSQRTPAHVAAFASQDDALIALANGGADMNALENRSYDVLTIAAVADDPEMVSLAMELGNAPDLITSVYEGTALIAAAHLGHHDVVARLVAGGAPLDHINNLAWTALIEAVVLGDGGPDHIKTVQILVDAGADRLIADRDGVTPLQHATSRGYAKMVKILQ